MTGLMNAVVDWDFIAKQRHQAELELAEKAQATRPKPTTPRAGPEHRREPVVPDPPARPELLPAPLPNPATPSIHDDAFGPAPAPPRHGVASYVGRARDLGHQIANNLRTLRGDTT